MEIYDNYKNSKTIDETNVNFEVVKFGGIHLE
jgi:hypothetical protein